MLSPAEASTIYNLLIGIFQSKLKEEHDAKERIMEMLFAPNEDSRALAWVLLEGLDLLEDADLHVFMKNLANSNARYYLYKIENQPTTFNIPSTALEYNWGLQFWDIDQVSPLIKYWKNLTYIHISMDLPMYWWKKQRIKEMGKLSFLPQEIGSLTNLVSFHLTRMPVQKLPDSFTDLNSLEKVIITHTQLTELPPKIEKLKQLKILILSDNQITSLPENLAKLTQLQVFEIKNNPLQKELIPEILFDEKRSNKAIARALKKMLF